MHALVEWRDFYVMIGTAAGAIVGAAFIVVTLVANLEKRTLGVKGFITPIVVQLSSVLVGSAILTVPTLTPLSLAILLGAGGVSGVVYGIVVALRIWHMRLDTDDRIFYIILPVIAYAAMATSAIMACTHNEPTFETLAVSLVALLIIGIRNAWDMASFAIMQGSGEG
jgi:hypothetical protein